MPTVPMMTMSTSKFQLNKIGNHNLGVLTKYMVFLGYDYQLLTSKVLNVDVGMQKLGVFLMLFIILCHLPTPNIIIVKCQCQNMEIRSQIHVFPLSISNADSRCWKGWVSMSECGSWKWKLCFLVEYLNVRISMVQNSKFKGRSEFIKLYCTIMILDSWMYGSQKSKFGSEFIKILLRSVDSQILTLRKSEVGIWKWFH